MARRTRTLLAAAIGSAGLVAALTLPATASPAAVEVSPDQLAAMQRDLGLTAEQARTRLASDDRASRLDHSLRKQLGQQFGGAYIDGGQLVVTITDGTRSGEVRTAGAQPRLVARSESTLEAIKSRLDDNLVAAPRTVSGWYVDVANNTVVVNSQPHALAAARAFAAASGAPADAVRVVASTEEPRPLIDVVGGNAYYIGGSRCSVGFSVTNGFVTAGHCGNTGASTSQPTGTFRGSSFPGNDYAWVQVAAGNTPIGAVNNYSGGRVSVAGSQDAAVGATVCRSGSTTGWRCGTIQARNASVTYPQGTVNGLIRTSVCAEPGDSGGSLLAGSQAQGVTSGGSGNCSSGGTTYFQPVNEILQAYGLTLLTSGGNPPPPPPGCSGAEFTYTGSLSSGGSQYQPNGSYYYSSSSGAHIGCLDGPTGTDFDLYLQKWNGYGWVTVASGTTPAADENVSYNGTAGYYRYRVHAYSGSGSYTLGVTNP
jgi:streptogrisin C